MLRPGSFFRRRTCPLCSHLCSTRSRRLDVSHFHRLVNPTTCDLDHALTCGPLHTGRPGVTCMYFHPRHAEADCRLPSLVACHLLHQRPIRVRGVHIAKEQDGNDLFGEFAHENSFALLGKPFHCVGQTESFNKRLPVGMMFTDDSGDAQQVELGHRFAALV